MESGSSQALIDVASQTLRPHFVGDRLFGNVASCLITRGGNQFVGVWAIAAMVTAGEYEIDAIVAVWRDQDDRLFVLPPCGRCREFMRQIDEANLDATVVLGTDESALLRELLPRHAWPSPIAGG